jgi:cytochrome c5
VSGPSHDKHFFDTFMLVLGILVLIAFGLYFGASAISSRTQEAEVLEDPMLQASINERIAPVGKVAISGEDNSAVEEKVEAAAELKEYRVKGLQHHLCSLPRFGTGGAPKIGDALMGTAYCQGIDTLHKHSIEGLPAKLAPCLPRA